MTKKIVIAGSASMQENIRHWKEYWEKSGYRVIDHPSPIPEENFLAKYPGVHTDFFKNITEADILFVMNEDKDGVAGYLGAESFAEMCFGVAQNLIYNKNLKVLLMKEPSKEVQSYEEIVLWLKLGWIKIHGKNTA